MIGYGIPIHGTIILISAHRRMIMTASYDDSHERIRIGYIQKPEEIDYLIEMSKEIRRIKESIQRIMVKLEEIADDCDDPVIAQRIRDVIR